MGETYTLRATREVASFAFECPERFGEEPKLWPIRSALTVPEIAELAAIDEAISRAKSFTEQTEGALRAYRYVMGLVREYNPDAPDLPIQADDLVRLMAAIANGGRPVEDDESASEVVGDALIAGIPEDERERLAEEGKAEAENGDGPLGQPAASKKRSRRQSSSSAASKSGSQGSGGRSRGRTPVST